MGNFYATFPSNASIDVFPDNTTSHYTTRLRDLLDLRWDQWEVAVVETTVPTLWQSIDDDNSIKINSLDSAATVLNYKIPPDYYDSDLAIITAINKAWRQNNEKDLFTYDDTAR